MMKKNLLITGSLASLSVALIALPGTSRTPQNSDEPVVVARFQKQVDDLKAQQRALMAQARVEKFEGEAEQLQEQAIMAQDEAQKVENFPDAENEEFTVLLGDEGSSWLGIETREVNSGNAKELKLPSERGVLVGKIIPDGPAAKAGLKENDVVTEFNSQHVEGVAQFRRLVRETPAGRTAQLTIWRDGRSQSVSVTLGKAEEHRHHLMHGTPGAFAFRMPEIPEVPEIPDMPPMIWDGMVPRGGHPRLGIDAEDLNGQLGTYFGAPEGEGVLVRDVNSGSPAEKAGMKAGDVITSIDGQRIRSLGDLREKLAAKQDEKPVKIGMLRNKSEVSLTVELPAVKAKRFSSHRTHI